MSEEKETLWAYYETPWITIDLANEMQAFFGDEIQFLQHTRRDVNGKRYVKFLCAISQGGLAKGRAHWEESKKRAA